MAKIQETDEANDLLEQIEEQEKSLWQLTLALNTAKLDVKEKQKAFDAGIAEMRRLARTRLEANPLFDDLDEPDDCSEPPSQDDPTVTLVDHGKPIKMKRSHIADHIISSVKAMNP